MAGLYLPSDDLARADWLNTFVQKLTPLAASLNVTPARLASIAADAAAFDYAIKTLLTASRGFDKSITAFKKSIGNGTGAAAPAFPVFPTLAAPPAPVRPGIFGRVSLLVRHIKAQPGYTEEIGHLLGIIGSESDADPETAKPTFTADALVNGEVRLKWLKGAFDGVSIEGRAPGSATWTPLGIDHFSPFVDTRDNAAPGQPEVREYRLRYQLKDEPIGEWSDTVSVTTKP